MNIGAEYLIWLSVAHLVADWLLQNEWMATNKASLKNPAAWAHGSIHFVLSWIVVPIPFAALIAFTHMLIDTRKPMQWWNRFFRCKAEGDVCLHVGLWRDQTAHLLILSVVSLMAAGIA